MSDLLNSASLVLIPSGYKEDTVYSVVPSDGSGDLSFTRASNGTRVNSAGLVEVCPWNLIQQSNSFSTSPWALANSTLASGQTGYDGSTNAWRLNDNATNARHMIIQTPSVGGQVTFTIYAKANASNFLWIRGVQNSVEVNGWFNLSTGVLGTIETNGTGAIESVGNGWYKCSLTIANFENGFEFYVGLSNANAVLTYAGGSGSIFIQNSQLNIGSTAKPYFPTTDRLNVPRLTYQNGGGGCPSLLLEKQSTNYALSSEDFANTTYWTVSGSMAVTANQATSPDGTQNADLLYDSGARYNFVSSPVSSYYTFSCYFKRVDVTNVKITASDYYSGDVVATFNLVALTSSSSVSGDWSNVTSKIESVGNGWYRCSVTSLRGAGGSGVAYRVECSESAKSFYAWGYQAEASSYPTSYIPTTAASATRVADACSKTGISSLIGQTEGVWFADYVLNGQTNNANILNSEKNTTCALFMSQEPDGDFNSGLYINGSLVGFIVAPVGLTVGQRVKVAYAYKSGSFALYINGNQEGILSSTFTFPTTLDDIFLNDETYFNYKEAVQYNQVALFKTRLTNAELASLTTI
jgi:hypothetical protein